MKKHQIFISSTFLDLKDVRAEVIRGILGMNHIPAAMEFFATDGKSLPLNYVEQTIERCEYFVLIIAGRYGADYKDDKAFTQLEFEYSQQIGLPALCILPRDLDVIAVRDSETDGKGQKKLREFIEEIKKSRIVKEWSEMNEIPRLVTEGIANLIRTCPRPGWTQDYSPYLNGHQIATEIFANISRLKLKANEFVDSGKFYELTVLDWIIKSATERLDYLGGDIYRIEISEPYETMRNVFGSIITRLSKFDNYHTISTLAFWMNDLGNETKFIEDNLSAVEADVKIERIILIDANIFRKPKIHLRQLVGLDNLINEFIKKRNSYPSVFNKIKTMFYLTEDIGQYEFAPCAIIFDERDIQINGSEVVGNIPSNARYLQISRQNRGRNSSNSTNAVSFHFNSAHRRMILANHKKFLEIRNSENLRSIDEMRMKIAKIEELSKALKNIKYISDFRQTGSVILYAEAYAIADVESTDSAAETNIMDFTNGALIKIQSRDSDRKYTIVDTYDKIRSLEGAHKSTAKILVSETRWKLFYIGIPDALNVSGFIAFVSKIFADEGIPICLYSMVDAEYVLVGEADLSKSLMVLNENDIELISAIGPTH